MVVLDSGFSGIEDVDEETGSELELLTTELSDKNEEVIRKHLKRAHFSLTEPSMLAFVTRQPGVRVEQVRVLFTTSCFPAV